MSVRLCWTHTTPDGTTLTVVPARLRETPDYAEVIIRIATAGQPSTEASVLSRDLPAMIDALAGNRLWSYNTLDDTVVELAPFGGGGMLLTLTGDPEAVEEQPQVHVPEEQRLPLVDALRQALDAVRGWED